MSARKNTAVVEVRSDLTVLATIARYQTAHASEPRTKSELVRMALEHYCELLVLSDLAERVTSQAQASEILASLGMHNLSNKVRMTLVKALAKETQEEMDSSLLSMIERAKREYQG